MGIKNAAKGVFTFAGKLVEGVAGEKILVDGLRDMLSGEKGGSASTIARALMGLLKDPNKNVQEFMELLSRTRKVPEMGMAEDDIMRALQKFTWHPDPKQAQSPEQVQNDLWEIIRLYNNSETRETFWNILHTLHENKLQKPLAMLRGVDQKLASLGNELVERTHQKHGHPQGGFAGNLHRELVARKLVKEG